MLLNDTPFAAQTHPIVDSEGRRSVLVVAKGAWLLDQPGEAPRLRNAPIRDTQESRRIGELPLEATQRQTQQHRLEERIVWYPHDLSPPKPHFDCLVVGYAHAPDGRPAMAFEAGIAIGRHAVVIRLHAPRVWQKAMLGYRLLAGDNPVATVPLSYAFAFGGSAAAAPPRHPVRNPLGMGDITARGHPESEPLPWIEDPHALVRGPTDTPKPAGFGPWPENAWHRIAHAGTYDDQWRKTRSPLPPKDFHPRYFNCAHPQLQLDAPPAPGCQVRAINLSAAPLADFSVPEIHLEVTAARRGISRSWPLHMDTLTLDTEAREISLRWSAGIPIPADTEPALRLGLGSGRPT